jgi:hypothetical protein
VALQADKPNLVNDAAWKAYEDLHQEESESTEEEHRVHWTEEDADYQMNNLGDSAAAPIVMGPRARTHPFHLLLHV